MIFMAKPNMIGPACWATEGSACWASRCSAPTYIPGSLTIMLNSYSILFSIFFNPYPICHPGRGNVSQESAFT